MKVLKFNSFISEELNIHSLDLRTKQEIIHNFKQRILELKSYWGNNETTLSIYDKRIILRQFENEFSKDMITDLKFDEFLEEALKIFSDKKELIKLLNKYLQTLGKL